jgi:hypothetical protein
MNRILLSSLLVSSALAGCAPSDEVATSSDALIGGVPAPSARLDAIGAVVEVFPDRESICTGTLVTPTVVITAKHCFVEGEPPVIENLEFRIGPDLEAPRRVVKVRSIAVEDTIEGGLLGVGADVAVAHLAEPVTGVPLFGYGAFDPDTIGDPYTVAGFGIEDNDETVGRRRVGTITLRAVTGSVWKALFGSFEVFLQNAPLIANFPTEIEILQDIFENEILLDQYEAQFGDVRGDAQPCSGDSGGPVIQLRDGRPTVVAVTSNGVNGTRLRCDFGQVEATFGPAVIEFLDRETQRR